MVLPTQGHSDAVNGVCKISLGDSPIPEVWSEAEVIGVPKRFVERSDIEAAASIVQGMVA